MKFFTNLSDTTKGILLIIGGIILLLDVIGIGGQTIKTVILIAAVCFIVLGIYISKAHQKIYTLLAKEKKVVDQPEESKPEEEQRD